MQVERNGGGMESERKEATESNMNRTDVYSNMISCQQSWQEIKRERESQQQTRQSVHTFQSLFFPTTKN